MRARPNKEPARQTRSGAAGKAVARPKRAATQAKPKASSSDPKKRNDAKKNSPAQTQTQTQSTSTKAKPVLKKVLKKEKEQPRDLAHDHLKTEPVEVVISVKKPRKKTEPAKMGVTSGKVGKRKGKHKADNIKKEVLKKLSSKSDEKLEDLVNTIVEVAVKKVVPKKEIKTEKPTKEKSKKDPKKKPDNKKEKEDHVRKEKEEPPKKDVDKKSKESKKDGKQEKKTKEEIRPSPDIKEEKEETVKLDNSKNEKGKEDGVKEMKTDKVIKKEKDVEPKDKKKTTKSKPKDKEKKEPKKPQKNEESSVDKAKSVKPKIKLEKISPVTVKDENVSSEEAEELEPSGKASKSKKPPPKPKQKRLVKKKTTARKKPSCFIDNESPIIEKRHREASLNALAKVHCLYENESRGAMNEMLDKTIPKRKEDIKLEKVDVEDTGEEEDPPIEVEEEKPTRNLRSAPGMRGVGRHWDILNASSTSSSEAEDTVSEKQEEEEEPKEEQKPEEKKTRKRRKRCELMMDLKDMVVRKRMASLNASAMMAASYQVEKRNRPDDKRRSGRSTDDSTSSAVCDSSDDEVTVVSGSSKKVAVIVNQDTDVTITGLYTTRSTRHEGYCSIAGMQYRISSTSHTQTEATAVSSETVIHTTDHVSVSHSESGGSVDAGTSSPGGSCKSYTPLGALSSMQPPGQGRACGSSAFSAPPYHPHPQEMHGYYQPAGPLISSGGSKSGGTPEPPYPPYPYPAYDYPPSGYYRYRRPWPSTSQMMDYLEPPYPPHPNYYPYPAPPPPPPPPPPVCYTSPVRLPFIEQGYQTCPCPMSSSCPKNVHTGPLIGASKRSESEAQNTPEGPLLPIALALPPEPTGASPGPPSPARGSAGMPPPASPALSTARNNSWSPPAQGLLKPVTPPPPQTLTAVESPPPPPAPAVPTTPKRKVAKRASVDCRQEPQRKKKRASGITAPKVHNKKGAVNKTAVVKAEIVKAESKPIPKKTTELVLRKNPSLKWSNGWSWEGESFMAKVYLTTEDTGVIRKCYPAMRHREGDLIRPKDCILLRSGPRKNLPFVAKITAMWENPEDNEMMVSVLWYYRPEHTEQGRLPGQPPDEIFASKHKDTNSVACIEDKCYVLTFNEYCRYRKSLITGGKACHTVVPPLPEVYPRADKLPPCQVSSDLIFFCRQIYDFRQKKILKKPPFFLPPRS